MKKFKVSAVYASLCLGGTTLMSVPSFATECRLHVTISNNDQANLNQCTQSTDQGYGVRLENSTLSVSDSQLSVSGTDRFYQSSEGVALEADHSTLNIRNSKLSSTTEARNNYVIKADNANVNIANSTLTVAYQEDDGGALVDLEKSTVSISDSTLVNNAEIESLRLANASTAILTNVSAVNTYNDSVFLTYSQTNNKATLTNVTSNSTFLADSWWHADGRVEHGSLDLTVNESKLKSKALLSTAIYDEDNGSTFIETVNLTANNSTLSGVISMDSKAPPESVYTMTLNNSSWTTAPFTYTSPEDDLTSTFTNKLTNLALNNGTVNLSKTDGFQTLTLGNLSGTGTFSLNTDLANQQSDKVIVTDKDSGNFKLVVADSGNEPQAANGLVTLVETQTGTAQFALANRDYVDAGAYRYRLNKEGTNWVLSNKSAEQSTAHTQPVTPVAPVMPVTPVTPVTPSQPTTPAVPVLPSKPVTPVSPVTPRSHVVLSEKSNALVSLRQAQLLQVEQSLQGIHQRLGELKSDRASNVWVKNSYSRNKFEATETAPNAYSSGFKQDIYSVQIGADTAVSDRFRVGGFVGSSRSNVDFNGEYGSGKIKSQGVGLYGTLLADNGLYWDNIAKYDHVKSESNSTGDRRYNAYTLATEVGRIHTLTNGWSITPQVQLAWTHLSSLADEDSLSAVTARAGVRVNKAFDVANWRIQPYLQVDGVTSRTRSNAVRVNQYRFEVEEASDRLETALGISASTGNHRFGLEGAVAKGKNLDQPYKVQAVYRYQW